MLCTVKIKLLADSKQHESLLSTMKRFNQACNHISAVAFEKKVFAEIPLHKLCYYDVREQFGLSAQMVVRAIGKVSEAYKVSKKTECTFRETGAMVYDQRILSFRGLERASMLTLDGRIEVPMLIGRYHHGVLAGRRVRGQADLILQDGTFYLLLVIDVPELPLIDADDFLGVDMGIVNIATDSAGENFSGSAVNNVRCRNARLRGKLQSKGTKSAKRKLKKLSGKERRFARDVNHVTSKRIVEKAKALGVGVAIEDLLGIRTRMEKTVRKRQRYRHSSWSFYQLRQFIEYKAAIAGVPVEVVDPRYTSQACPECGLVDRKNRKTRDNFCCVACGYAAPADNVAAMNIRSRAVCQSAERGVA